MSKGWAPGAVPAGPAPVRVELVGHVPMSYRLCPRGLGYALGCGLGSDEGRPGGSDLEYPEPMRRRGEVLAEWHRRLLAEFGPQVLPVPVPLTTPRGFWLALRHGLRSDEVAAVVAGWAVREREGYEAVRQAVAAALGQALAQ